MKTFLFVITLSLLFGNTFEVQADEVSAERTVTVAGHPNYPPIMWEYKGQTIGVASRIVEEFFSEYEINVDRSSKGPWKRVHGLAKHGYVDVIASCYMNDERASYLIFSDPILKDEIKIFVKKGNVFAYEKWDDLIDKKGVTLYGDSYGEAFDRFSEEKLRIKRVESVDLALESLLNDEVDYMFFGYYPTIVRARFLAYDSLIEDLRNPLVSENMHIAFSNQSDYKGYLDKFNESLKVYIKKGLIKKWSKEYLDMHLSQIKK